MSGNDVKAAYEQLEDAIPDVGDVNVVIHRVRRRRVAVRLGAPAVVAVAVAGALAVGQLWPSGGQNAQVAATPSAATFALDDWAEPMSDTNTAARPGTFMSTCALDDVCLHRPDGRELRLSKVRPDLARLLKRYNFDSAGLSWDAQWLGLRAGRAYQLSKLTDRDRSITVPAGPTGSAWEAVGWSPDSRSVALAAFKSKRAVRYAWVSLEDGTITTYDPVAGSRALPERLDSPDGVVIASPIDTSRPGGQRTRVTKLATDVLQLVGDDQGKVRKRYDQAPDLERYLRDDETLVGERGVASSSCAPGRDPSAQPLCVTVVWGVLEGQDGSRHPRTTGAVQTLAPERRAEAIRWDLPRSFDWAYVGLLPTGEVAADRLRPNDETMDLVAIDRDGKRRVIGRHLFAAAILLPGMTLPNCCREW